MRCNRKTLGELLGHDVKTVDKMVRQGMPYVKKPGEGDRSWIFDTGEVLGWMTRDPYKEQMKAARSRLLEAKAGIKWLEYGQALGHLVRIDDVLPQLEEVAQVVKSRLGAMPGRLDQRLAAETDPMVIEKILSDEFADMFQLMDRMAKAIPEVAVEMGKARFVRRPGSTKRRRT